ncbi:unnamed protein product [Caenorhabditis auriculariae]|uniref:MADF domain-containing protein n=1 Tax=Caenorhabditis auriculariae TaxID=2777116 RepID=A0A8S1HQ66_9PELO|nr:unnamed protein product [Caenorhabditis auriculariae]
MIASSGALTPDMVYTGKKPRGRPGRKPKVVVPPPVVTDDDGEDSSDSVRRRSTRERKPNPKFYSPKKYSGYEKSVDNNGRRRGFEPKEDDYAIRESIDFVDEKSEDDDDEDSDWETARKRRRTGQKPAISRVGQMAVVPVKKRPYVYGVQQYPPDELLRCMKGPGMPPLLPHTLSYKREANSIFLPPIDADMIQGNGLNASVVTYTDSDFKYARAVPKTKADHADPEKVRAIIAAVKKYPVIWDQRLTCHTDPKYTHRAWRQIEEQLKFDPQQYPLRRLKQIWKNKKDYYVTATHAGTIESRWTFTKDLEFYRPCINYRLQHTVNSRIVDDNGLSEKFLIAKRTLICSSDDKQNVLSYLLKMVKDASAQGPEKVAELLHEIENIFTKNYRRIYRDEAKTPPRRVSMKQSHNPE